MNNNIDKSGLSKVKYLKMALGSSIACLATSASGLVSAEETIFVGHLADMSGPTAFVGKPYADGVRDSLAYINAHGGIDGIKLEYETIDYAYKCRKLSHHTKNGSLVRTWWRCKVGAPLIPKR